MYFQLYSIVAILSPLYRQRVTARLTTEITVLADERGVVALPYGGHRSAVGEEGGSVLVGRAASPAVHQRLIIRYRRQLLHDESLVGSNAADRERDDPRELGESAPPHPQRVGVKEDVRDGLHAAGTWEHVVLHEHHPVRPRWPGARLQGVQDVEGLLLYGAAHVPGNALLGDPGGGEDVLDQTACAVVHIHHQQIGTLML